MFLMTHLECICAVLLAHRGTLGLFTMAGPCRAVQCCAVLCRAVQGCAGLCSAVLCCLLHAWQLVVAFQC